MDVICGVDLVDAAPSEVAAAIASATGGSLHLVHAWQPVQPAMMAGAGLAEPAVPPAMLADASRETEIAVRERLSARAALLAHGGLKVTWDVSIGPAASRLLEALESRGADLIVVGAPAGGRALRWILGSTVEPIARRSHVPVLVVRPPVQPLLQWIAGEHPLRVVAGVGPDGFESIADTIDRLRLIGPVEADFVHALEPAPEEVFDRMSVGGLVDLEPHLQTSLLPKVAARFEARVRLSRERPDRAIVRTAARSASDLVLVGTHGRRGLERALERSISTAVLRSAPCSVLVTPLVPKPVHAEPVSP